MKIIKEGNIKLLNETRIFICYKCGCEFEADKGEYKAEEGQYNQTDYSCDCPTCKSVVIGGKFKYERKAEFKTNPNYISHPLQTNAPPPLMLEDYELLNGFKKNK